MRLNKLIKNAFKFTLSTLLIIFLSSFIILNELYAKPTIINTNHAKTRPKCNPFNENKQSEHVLIDGKIYPQVAFNYSFDFECLNSNTQPKTILFWHQVFDSLDKSLTLKDLKCPVYNCNLTNKRDYFNESHMILFYMPTLYQNKWQWIPRVKYSHQTWVFTSYESPAHYDAYSRFNGIFDLSATYRLDSDFTSFYATQLYTLKWGTHLAHNVSRDYYAEKTHLVAVLISNCGPYDKSNRYEYIRELNRTVPVHVYGKCGVPCPVRDCRAYISSMYKFYLSFENSLCKDYITEKFFDLLQFNTIPIVRGASTHSYSKYIPHTAFINSLDFSSPHSLGIYLRKLSEDRVRYNAYFKWKMFVSFDASQAKYQVLCEMCIELNLQFYNLSLFNRQKSSQRLNDLDAFWSRKSDCLK